MQLIRYLRLFSASLLLFALSMSALAQRQSSKAAPKGKTQTQANVSQMFLEDSGAAMGAAMAFGQDGMLYILSGRGERYDKGALYKADPQAFSRLLRGKDNRYHAAPEDLTAAYVFGRPGEPSNSSSPGSMIAGADGKLYISGSWEHCARFDPKTQSMEWIKYGPERNDPAANNMRDPNVTLFDVTATCFAVAPDGLLWCKAGNQGYGGAAFHTRGKGKDLGGITGTEKWNYAALGADGYLYGATDDALIRVKTDGSDITVLHAFTGKNDHPVGAPILIGNTLFGCAHDQSKVSGERLRDGYIYKLNSDGTGYSTVVNLDYDPEKLPFMARGNSVFGIAPAGLFTFSIDQPAPKVITPLSGTPELAVMAINDNAAFVLMAPNQVEVSVFRVPLAETAQTTTVASPLATVAAGQTSAVVSNSAPSPAPSAGGKSIFHKRDAAPGTDSPVTQNASTGGATTQVSPPSSSTAVGVTDAAASNPAAANSAAPVPGGKSVFHKRDTAGSSGVSSSQQRTAEQQPSSVSGFSSDSAQQTAGARSAGGGTPASTKKTINQTNDSGPLSGDTAEDASQTDAGADQEAPGGSASSFGGLGSNRTNSYAGTSAGGGSDTSAIAGMVVEAYSNGDLATFASLYADTVDYMGHRRTSNADVQRQLSQYFDKWPVRQWQLVGTVSVRPVGPSAQRVAFSAQYDLSNPNTNSHAAGIANETLIVKDDGTGAMKITSHQEKVNSNSDSDTAGEKKRRRPNRERVYDGRPILPPNVPWPFPIPRP